MIGTCRPLAIPMRRLEEEVCPAAADREEPGVLEEEGALLGEEQAEAGQVDLLVVHLDLREVRVVRRVERDPLRDLELGLPAELVAPVEGGLAAGVVARGRAQQVGRDGTQAMEGQLEAGQVARVVEAVEVELAGDRGPERLLVPAADLARDVEPPDRVVPVPERVEGDPELRVPALAVAARRDVPGSVPVLVEAAAGAGLHPALRVETAAEKEAASLSLVGDLAVVLDPRRRRPEHERVLVVVVRIEREQNRVGLGDLGVPDPVSRMIASASPSQAHTPT